MTSTMKIVRLFECENPPLTELFEEYRKRVMKIRLGSDEIEHCKMVVENYIIKNLSDSIFKYKLYSYKFYDAVRVEILLKPTETASIMEYHLVAGPNILELKRVR